MKRYRYLIFDADHTLIDFEADEREAFKKIFAECGTPFSAKANSTKQKKPLTKRQSHR